MINNLKELSLTDLFTLKRYLMSRENTVRLNKGDSEEALNLSNQGTVVEAEIKERVNGLFQD
jgi:hypothetical protein